MTATHSVTSITNQLLDTTVDRRNDPRLREFIETAINTSVDPDATNRHTFILTSPMTGPMVLAFPAVSPIECRDALKIVSASAKAGIDQPSRIICLLLTVVSQLKEKLVNGGDTEDLQNTLGILRKAALYCFDMNTPLTSFFMNDSYRSVHLISSTIAAATDTEDSVTCRFTSVQLSPEKAPNDQSQIPAT